MSQAVAILGRQPAFGLAELERLYRPEVLRRVGSHAALLEISPQEVQFDRLGGLIKLGKLLTILPTTNWNELSTHLIKNIPKHLHYIPEGKIRLGLGVHDLHVSVDQLNRTGLAVKKVIKKADRSVRVIPNTMLELSSAQSLHNQTTGPTGLELVLIRDGSSTLLVQIVAVQDINAYAARDQKRPMRDARVGMLPPKLAQTIINLAKPPAHSTVLDPFCGTGVILQEAILMDLTAYGTDLEPRMIDYSRANLNWLIEKNKLIDADFRLDQGDATDFQWEKPVHAVAAETYLGRPFSSPPTPATLQKVIQDVNLIHKKFLQNLAKQLPAETPICLAVPAWKQQHGFKHLPVLDQLTEMGYTRLSFVHASNEDLIYHRENQIVARELVVMIRK